MRLVFASLVLVVGCSHVELKLPPADASSDERQHAYGRLRPKGTEQYQMMDAHVMKWTGALVLNNDLEVTDPVDLLPVVPADSETAKAIASYEQRNKPWAVLAPIAGYSFAAGASTLLFGLGTAIAGATRGGTTFGQPYDNAIGYATLVGVAVMIIVPLAALITGFFIVPDTEDDRARAFHSYDHDLKRALGLDTPAPAPEAPSPELAPAPAAE